MDYVANATNFEGIHFLAAFDTKTIESEDDLASWNSSISDDEDEIEVKHPPAKKLCKSDVQWEPEESKILNLFPFTGDSGMKFGLVNPEPIDVFNYLCTPEFINGILAGTNRYARDLQAVEGSSFGTWKPLVLAEFKVFLGLLFHTGTIRMNNLSDYWSPKRLFDIKVFRNGLPMKRFVRILSALRFDKNAVACDEEDNKIEVLESLVTYFNKVMETVYYPGRELVIDDCLAVTSTGLVPRQSINSMFDKPKLLVHSLCEPNGLIHKIMITGDSIMNCLVVDYLMAGKNRRGHSLFLDSWYCNVSTVQHLIDNKTYCTGVLNRNHKSIPEELRQTKVAKGGLPVMKFTKQGVCLMKWRGREEVYAISSEFRDSNNTHDGKHKPLMIRECRKATISVDRRELFTSYKPIEGKNVGWYRAVGIHFLQTLLRNAFLLYTNNIKKTNYHDFRLSIVDSLLKRETGGELIPSDVLPMDSDELHVPRKFPKRQGQRSLRKRCKVCLKSGKRTDSYYHCPICPNQPALCLENCFAEYHNALKTKLDMEKQHSMEYNSDTSED